MQSPSNADDHLIISPSYHMSAHVSSPLYVAPCPSPITRPAWTAEVPLYVDASVQPIENNDSTAPPAQEMYAHTVALHPEQQQQQQVVTVYVEQDTYVTNYECHADLCGGWLDKAMDVYERNRPTIEFAAIVSGCVFALVSMVLSIVAYKFIHGYTHAFNDLIDNWQASPVIDLQVVYDYQSCPYGFTDHRMEWPGLNSACDCSTKRPGTNSTSSDFSTCGFQQRADGCYTRYSQYSARTVDLIPGYKVCTQSAGPSFLQQEQGTVQADGVSCSSPIITTQLCGSICWPNAIPCPLQHIEFAGSVWQHNTSTYDELRTFPSAPMMRFFLKRMVASSTPIQRNRIVENDYDVNYITYASLLSGKVVDSNLGFIRRRTLDSTDPNNHIVDNNSTAMNKTYMLNETILLPSTVVLDASLPLVNVEMSRGGICLLSGCGYDRTWLGTEIEYKFLRPSEGYMLQSFDCDGGCLNPSSVLALSSDDARDARYTIVMQNVERDVYQSYARDIPSTFWPTSNGYHFTLNTRPRIPWSDACPIRPYDLINQSPAIHRILNCQLASMILSILFFVWGLVITIILVVNKFDAQVTKFSALLFWAGWIPRVGSFIIFLVTMTLAAKEYGFWQDLQHTASPCSDPVTSALLSGLADILHKLAPPNIVNVALSSIIISWHTMVDMCCKCNVITLLMVCLRCCTHQLGNVLGCARHMNTCCQHCGPRMIASGCTCCLRVTRNAATAAKQVIITH